MKFAFNLPEYRLQKLLASDRFCHYFQAIRLDDGMTVLIQVFNASFHANQAFRSQFDNISHFLCGKDFGVITPVYQVGWSEGCAYVVSAFFPLRPASAVSLPRLPLQHVLASSLRIANSLGRLHRSNLVYAAIEPPLILFNQQARVSLAPLPLQRVLPLMRKSAQSLLQPEQRIYLAPECGRELTAASDFYALGVVMYQMMFNRSPFSASEEPALEQEKLGLASVEVSDEFGFMTGFFDRQLHPDPAQRISNAADFRQALEDCGIGLEGRRLTLPIKPFAETRPKYDRAQATGQTRPGRSRRLVGGVALALGAVALAGWLNLERPPADSIAEQVEPDRPAERTGVASPADEAPANLAEQYYLQALGQFNEGRYAAALLTVNHALREDSGHAEASRLKQHAIREIELLPLFRTAQRQLGDARLVWPPGDNALESYRLIADRLEPGDHRAEQGLLVIAERLHQQASEALGQDDLESASDKVEAGLEIAPSHAALLNLRDKLSLLIQARELEQQRQRILAREQQQERERLERERQRQRLEQERKRKAFESILQARQQRERELEQQRLAQIEQRERIEANRYNVNRLLSSVRAYLVADRPSLEALGAANADFAEVVSLASPDDERLPLFRRDLINAHLGLAERLKARARYGEAMQAVEQGLTLNDSDLDLQVLRNELARLERGEGPR